MAKKFSELRARMSEPARQLADRKAKAMLAEISLDESLKMQPLTRTRISDILVLCAAVGMTITWFFSGIWSLLQSILVGSLSFVLVLVAAWIRPPFWWGNRTFTTRVNDPSNEAKQVKDTSQVR